MKRHLRAAVLAVAATLSLASVSAAHEIGITQASATFTSDGAYHIDIVVDPDALLTKLIVAEGGTPGDRPAREERDRQIAARAGTFLDQVVLAFDGSRQQPRFEYRPASAFSDLAQAPSTVRLSGTVQAGVRAMTFGYGLAIGSYAFNVRVGDDSALQTFWLEGTRASDPISLVAPPPPPTWREVAVKYFALGYTHILPKGLDHILFVLGIFLLSARWRSVLLQVSTFTVAHSITLGLTMYGLVSMPAKAVEPMIALSIVYVAVENLATSELKPWRLALVFSFGLLHGMGFAGVLRDLGLPHSQFLTALITFNAGVEAGQLSVIALAFAAIAYWRSKEITYRRLIVQPASVVIALIGLYWTVQRALS